MIPLRLASAALLALVCAGPAAAQSAQGQSQPMQVGVLEMTLQDVPQTLDLPGRAVAFEQVDVRPRVDGVITKILYTPGTPLKVGDPLFQLDDAAYAATAASDAADLAEAQANLPVKQAAYDRAVKLKDKGYTQAEIESAQSELASAKAALDAAQAALDYAQTQLSWTTVQSPIEGFADVAEVSVGDLVTSGQSDAMTTVTRLDPIYVDMLQPSSRLLEVRSRIENGTLTPNAALDAKLRLEDGQVYTGSGSFVSPSTTVSTTTGTVSVRFKFENPDNKILPGMFLRGTVELGTSKAFLVPQRAAQRASNGDLTAFVVGDESTAQQVTLTTTGSYQNSWIVTDGLDEGQQLILDGQKTMAAGTAVEPVPSQLDENGLVQPLQTAANESE
ncbi:efflux RND transporter periplasmic adaptor subunit [Salipiger sp. CCB-MM3]|uniref:efflux RND transporter periplasmic adaptor subunit n=1 Tax=Salipiger sp. CCB-MM3 TaxID=1792508 RepID=UPI000826A97A|nr:efflux RND transporter periplasmic adaptor subunit [Salipiger sp. CCB-MM3]